MTQAQLIHMAARLEQLEQHKDGCPQLCDDALRLLRSWLRQLKRNNRGKIVDINEYRFWRNSA